MAVSDAYFIEFWKQYEDGYDYGEKSSVYAIGYHRGQDIPVGPSYQVPSLTGGTVAAVGQSAQVGGYVIVESGGIFYGYGHVKHDYGPQVGQRIERGTVLGRPAGWDDGSAWQGTSWKGPHIHLTTTRERSGLTNSYGPSLDPRTYIRAALTTTAASTSRPTPIVTFSPEEDDMPLLMRRRKTGQAFSIRRGQLLHVGSVKEMKLLTYLEKHKTGRSQEFIDVDETDIITVFQEAGLTQLIEHHPGGVRVNEKNVPRRGGLYREDYAGVTKIER